MKLESINIDEFSNQDEYDGAEKDGLRGQSLLIKGENMSGKTITFNALRYLLLGETIDITPGRGSKLEVTFDDGSRFFRGLPTTEFEDADEDEPHEAMQARQRLREATGPEELLEVYFLHSHIEQLPLESMSKADRVDLIRSVINSKKQALIKYNSKAASHLEWIKDETRDQARKLDEKADELEKKVSSFEGQVERAQKIVSMGESGQLGEIKRILENHSDLDQQIQNLFDRKEAIRQSINKKENRRDRFRSYEREVDELITEAVNDFVCPACETSVPSREAEIRLGKNRCPFCDQRTSIGDLRDELQEKKESTEGLADELQEEIGELREERKEIQREVQQIKAEMPSLEELDPDAKRRLNRHDRDIDAAITEAREEAEEYGEKLQSKEVELEEVSEEIDSLVALVESLEERENHAKERTEVLQEETYQDSVSEFTDRWSDIFSDATPSISQEIGMNREGEIYLPGTPSDRAFSSDELSDSERQLLNFTFAITINEFTDDDLAPLNTVVLDEPFNHLDETSTREVLDFILEDDDRQYIFTSSKTAVWDAVPVSQTLELERGAIQSKLSKFS